MPKRPWSDVTVDFIVELPPSQGHNAMIVFVDRLTKMCHLALTNTTCTSEQACTLYVNNVMKSHGIPDTITSDRGPHFIATFWKAFHEMLQTKAQLSTARHPQTDGQTERTNQTLEQYLRCFTNYHQDDWSKLLPFAEFTYNNTYHDTIKTTPFFANYGYHPRFDPTVPGPATEKTPATKEFAEKLNKIHEELRAELKAAQEAYKEQADKKRKPHPDFKIGDQVMLSRKGLKTARPCEKLDHRKLGPFKIIEKINPVAYRLELPHTMQIHPVFHVSLLEPYVENTIPGRTVPPPPTTIVDGQEEFEVEEILDSLRYIMVL
jgi:hypothetical protein